MKKLGLFLAALTAVSFVSCDGALNAPKGAAPEQGAAAHRSYTGYGFSGKNGQAEYWLAKSQFTKETQQFLDPKYVGTDTVLETSIWAKPETRNARDSFEKVGIRTYDYSEAKPPARGHFKFNMLDVTALDIQEQRR